MAKAELLEEKQILETEARKLKIKEELVKAKARLSVYHDIMLMISDQAGEYTTSARDHKHQQTKIYNEDQLRSVWEKVDQIIKEEEHKSYQKTSSKKLLGAQDDSISEMMCLLLKEQPAPEIKIDVFDGKPMEFHYFLTDEKRVNDE